VFGLAEIILRVDWLYQLLRWAGVAFLLWLAFDTWRGGAADPGAMDLPRPSSGALLTRGFLANVLNPKAAVFYIALLPGFTDPARPFAGQALTLGLIHIAIALVIHAVIVLAAARAIPLLAKATGNGGRTIRIVFALALAAIALWLGWETRR
jgi:threonine/homoserine/homoserine lactone efflux protein